MMKRTSRLDLTAGLVAGVIGCVCVVNATGQEMAVTKSEPVTIEKGQNHRLIQRTVSRQLPGGRIWQKVETYKELANGLHYADPITGEWKESEPIFELFRDGVIARRTSANIILAPNINSPGAVDVSVGNARFTSVVLGIGIYEPTTGASELIAELKDSVGQLHPPDSVIYQDAFDGLRASLRYSVKRTGIEQDVIVLEGFTLPPNYNSATAIVEIWTEMSAPEPVRTLENKDGMDSERIVFGEMRIGSGRAFSIDAADRPSFPVSVQWIQQAGRSFLVEGVRYSAIQPEMARLGLAQAAVRKPAGAMVARVGQRARPFPAAKLAKAADPRKPVARIQTASVAQPRRGLLIDYDLQNNYGSLRIAGSETAHLIGTVIVTNLILEGGAVLKASSNAVLEVASGGTLDVQATPYSPVIFTAKDDRTVGAEVGTAAITGYYANPALRINSGTHVIQNVRFSYAREAIAVSGGNVTVRHGQFTFCQKAFGLPGTDGVAENALFYSVSNVVYGQNFRFHGRNVSVHQCASLTGDTQTNGTVTLTNSLLVFMTNWGVTPTVTTNLVVQTSTSPFQTVGAGSHYLTAYRNLGTTNIPADLLKDLRKTTTYPPQIIATAGYGTWSTNNLELLPHAQRDTDVIDLGYHYWPIDAVIGGLRLTNATVKASNGVVIATRDAEGFGLGLAGAGSFLSGGTAERPNRVVRYNTVQEQATTNWATYSPVLQVATVWGGSAGVASRIAARFTFWHTLASGGENIYAGYGYDIGTHDLIDCELHSADLFSYRPTFLITNCLFNRAGLTLLDETESISPIVCDTTFRGGTHNFIKANGGTWTFKDNLFDAATIAVQEGTFVCSSNAYTTNITRLGSGTANDVVLTVTNIGYHSGTLGYFYLPTNTVAYNPLLNSGTALASTLRLYHYTVSTNNVFEGTTTVDRGYHRVATNPDGTAFDYDVDGIPSYLEDLDGDGVVDSGESNWIVYNSLLGIGSGPGLVTFTPLKP